MSVAVAVHNHHVGMSYMSIITACLAYRTEKTFCLLCGNYDIMDVYPLGLLWHHTLKTRPIELH